MDDNWFKLWSKCPLGPRKEDYSGRIGDVGENARNWFCEKIQSGELEYADIHNRFGIPTGNLYRWVSVWKEKGCVKVGQGARARFNPDMKQEAKDFLRGKTYSVTGKEFKAKLKDLLLEDAKKKDPDFLPSKIKSPSKRAQGRLEAELAIKTANAEKTTNARAEACADIRNFVTYAAAAWMMRDINRYLCFNADATQFCISGAGTSKEKVKWVQEEDEDGNKIKPHHQVVPEKGAANDLTSFFVKWFALVNAGGHCATPVFIVADPAMPKDKFDAYPVDGLGFEKGAGKYMGWLVFCQTRCPPVAFYKWFFETVLVQFRDDMVGCWDLGPDEDQGWLTLDGEMIQIEPFLFDSETRQAMHNAKIAVGKLMASSTSKAQVLDCKRVFLSLKSRLKNMASFKSEATNLCGRKKKIMEVWESHKKKYPLSKLPAKNRVVNALLKIRQAQKDVLDPDLIIESWEECGLWVESKNGPDPEKIMLQCTSKIGKTIMEQVWSALPILVEIFKKFGKITEADLDQFPLFPRSAGKDKDALCISRNRFVFLLNHNIVQAEQEKREKRDNELAATKKRQADRLEAKTGAVTVVPPAPKRQRPNAFTNLLAPTQRVKTKSVLIAKAHSLRVKLI